MSGPTGDFEVTAGASIAGRGITIVTLLVCLDNPVSADAGDVRIDAQSQRPAIQRTRRGSRIVGQTQRPGTIGRLIGKTSGVGNGLFGSERANERSDARRNERCGRVAERRGREVRARRAVCEEFSLRSEGRGEENVEVGCCWVCDVNRRNDFPHDACLRDVHGAHCARVTVENWRSRQIGDDDRNFAGSARNIELAGARTTVAARHVHVVALFEAAQQAVATDRRTNARSAGASPASFDGTGRAATIIGSGIAVVAGFGTIDDSVAASNAIAHCARAADHVRRAHRAVHDWWIRTRTRHWVAGASNSALAGCGASDWV